MIAGLIAAVAGCGGDGDDGERAASDGVGAARIGDARLATTDPNPPGVRLQARERGADGVLTGVPALRPGDDVVPARAALSAELQQCSGTALMPTGGNMADVRRATLCLLNAERAARKLPVLRSNERLARAALRHSRDMVSKRFFAHNSPGGVDFTARIRSAGYLRGAGRWTVGENLAWGAGVQATPSEILQAWMASPGHRANILNGAYREIGIGIVAGVPVRGLGMAGATYSTEFGSRR